MFPVFLMPLLIAIIMLSYSFLVTDSQLIWPPPVTAKVPSNFTHIKFWQTSNSRYYYPHFTDRKTEVGNDEIVL